MLSDDIDKVSVTDGLLFILNHCKLLSNLNLHSMLKYFVSLIVLQFLKVFSKFLFESNLFLLQGVESIPAREVGYILRSLGQNPTEDEINNLICEAGCDWEVSNF